MRGFATPPAISPDGISPGPNGLHFDPSSDIPIDPALNGAPLDPALFAEHKHSLDTQFPIRSEPEKKATLPPQTLYSQGPQGDPFAPELPLPYIQPETPPAPQAKSVKKRRKTLREHECRVCGGDARNAQERSEGMLTCVDCSCKAHPTCLGLSKQADVVLSRDWQCETCKTCESCKQKDGDNRLLLCDSCDRGWHMDCLQPPLEQAPPGDWYCPDCPVPAEDLEMKQQENVEFIEVLDEPAFFASCAPNEEALRATSVASSSRSVIDNAARSKRKGKSKAVVTDESEAEMEVDMAPEVSQQASRRKLRVRTRTPADGQPPAEDMPSSPAAPSMIKRPRIRLSSPKPLPTLRLKLPARNKGKEREEDPEEAMKGMFDDLLPPEERDVTQTSIHPADKVRFDSSRISVEEKLMPPPPPPTSAISNEPGPSTRPLRSTHRPISPSTPRLKITPGLSASPAPTTPTPIASHAGLRIRSIRFGEYDIQTWYDAPFPEEYMTLPDGKLWICEFCLKYMKSTFNAARHRLKCKMRHPPGDEIYRDGSIAIFEVDGRKNKIYCQNLCLLSKMFLDHKSLFYDVEPFLFYVITDIDDMGARFVGYFSKEKRCPKDYNVSCIMTLPVRQRQGWGNLLIDFSYLLSKKERRAGSPEKPLSALGALGYKSYWTLALMRYLKTAPQNPRLEDISAATALTIEDIYATLKQQNMIHLHDGMSTPRPLPGQSIKFVKGRKSGVARKALHRMATNDDDRVKGPFVPPTEYDISWDPEVVQSYLAKWEAKGYLTLKPEKLKWSPFLVANTRKSETMPDGESSEAGVPMSATETLTPLTPTPATPHPLQSMRAESSTSRNDSPGFSLFDDDNLVVEVVRRSVSRPPRVLRRTRSQAQVQSPEPMDGPRSPAESASKDTSSRRLTRRKTSEVLSPSTPRRTRAAARSMPDDDELIAGDAALAAKLAAEDFRPRRLLRSRSNTEQEHQLPQSHHNHKRPLSPTVHKTTTPRERERKRKRVESPSPPARQTRSQGLTPASKKSKQPPPSRRSSLRNGVMASPEPTPSRRPKNPRKSSRLATEVTNDGDDDEDAPTPPASPSPISTGHEEQAEYEMAVDDAEEGQPAKAGEEDVHYADTPLTGMTSTGTARHSDGHSDDTVCANEDHAVLATLKVSPPLAVNARQTVELVSPTTIAMPEAEGGDLDAEGDADAEGEPDLDAEGEDDLDAEGEDDLDAEGEPDDGEDYEGED